MKRRTPLESGGNLKRTPLKSQSDKRRQFMADERVPLVQALVEAAFGCEIGPVLLYFGCDFATQCTGRIEGLHERRKRSAGGSLVNRQNLVPACNRCNGLLEEEPALIRELTGDILVVREGDPEWGLLGARNDS